MIKSRVCRQTIGKFRRVGGNRDCDDRLLIWSQVQIGEVAWVPSTSSEALTGKLKDENPHHDAAEGAEARPNAYSQFSNEGPLAQSFGPPMTSTMSTSSWRSLSIRANEVLYLQIPSQPHRRFLTIPSYVKGREQSRQFEHRDISALSALVCACQIWARQMIIAIYWIHWAYPTRTMPVASDWGGKMTDTMA